jgi:ATP-dependent exoDNAse (exonuclease V) beta subunit
VNAPIDQPSRDRFVSELDENFSVVAAAGSGKTRAITDRIVRIALAAGRVRSTGGQDRHARDLLPQLVVVAFTNRAADEMQQRARAEILRAGVSLDVLSVFNRAFFGTIHSFCVRLLETYGHRLGLPPQFDLITDDDELWNQFVQQQTTIGRSLSEENRRELLRHVQVRQLMELGRRRELDAIHPPLEKCPDVDFSAIHRYVARGPTLQTVPPFQKELRRAEQIWRKTDDFVRWPICNSKARDFVPIKREAFAPLRRWLDQASLCVAAAVQRDYREFRLGRGVLTYDDQVALALDLMRHPDVAREIRAKNFRVILDEAQDTDPRQFSLLLEITRPPEATGVWLQDRQSPPRPGHFSMVGDFQQSIYRDRADLSQYRRIHNTLVETNAAEELEFWVTFRLDSTQLAFVNETFREILNKIDNQVAFVDLSPRPQILPGQVVRLNLQPGNLRLDPRGKISDARKAAEEARQLAQWLRGVGLTKLRARSWSFVAILCPRKEWLQTLRRGLRDAGFTVQVQSEKESKGDSPAYAWLTALFVIMTQPRCGYEIVGVLRELFGISDHNLALFSCGHGDRFQIETLTNGSDIVSRKLSLLAQIRLSILQLPLFDAANELVRRTQLRERLRALPSEDFENLEIELDALLALAATSEAERMTLSEFAESLRLHFADAREARPSSADAIQLITSQKAKGSEWQAVIVPFLAREVRSGSPRYPRVFKNRETGETTLLWDESDRAEIKDLLDREERQEMERLLYVALTRARHTLVLAFDEALFAKTNGEIHKDSQLKWLKADKGSANQMVFASVATEAIGCALTGQDHDAASRAALDKIDKKPIAGKIDKNIAAKNASAFVRKLNPSGLPREEVSPALSDDEVFRSATEPSPALRYGVWWHDFVRQIPWESVRRSDTASTPAMPDTAEKIFERCRMNSPEPGRSTREWQLLRDYLMSDQGFLRDFSEATVVIHAEMPFLWKLDEERCLEGIVDLALFNRPARRWLILDWKTNRVTLDKIDALRAQYLSQLAAYWAAVREMTGTQVEAAIYSTPTAALLHYNEKELASEWSRLKKLPPQRFDVEVAAAVSPRPFAPSARSVQLEFTEL